MLSYFISRKKLSASKKSTIIIARHSFRVSNICTILARFKSQRAVRDSSQAFCETFEFGKPDSRAEPEPEPEPEPQQLPEFAEQGRRRATATISYVYRIKKCSKMKDLAYGKKIHAQILNSGLASNVYIASSLVNMYAKCGSLADAVRVFDTMQKRDAVCWNAIITAYAKLGGKGNKVIELCLQMKQEGFQPTGVTFVFMLHAYASLGALEKGKQLHSALVEAGLELDVYVGTALVNMYAKLGYVNNARHVFDRMLHKTLVSFTSMISGYAQMRNVGEAFALYNRMKYHHNLKPNSVTFVCILKACSNNATPQLGKQIHAEIIEAALESNVFVTTALIDMYAKCGSLADARQVFERSPKERVVAWNAIISGYAMYGNGVEAFQLFHQMRQLNVKPNKVTFLSVLCLCSRLGLEIESRYFFNTMINDYQLSPTFKHYGCLIDLFGRAGQLDEAILLIEESTFISELSLWMSFVGACRLHGNVNLAEYVAKRVLELDPQNSAACVLLSNLYAEGCSWSEQAELRVLMKQRGVRKEPGCSLMA